MSEEERLFLEIVDLKKGFGTGDTRQEVLRGMNFSVAKGEFCVLLGPSGSGKSTLLNIIGGIDNPDSGYISINGDKLELEGTALSFSVNGDALTLTDGTTEMEFTRN